MHSMKKYYRSVVVAGCLLAGGFTAAVSAAEPNFNYSAVSINLVGVSLDDDILVRVGTPAEGLVRYDSLSGINLNAAFQATPNLVIGAGVLRVSDSGFGTEIRQDELAIGLGYAAPVGPSTDLIVSGDVIQITAEVCNRFGCVDASDTGIGAAVGVRHWATRHIEINGSIGYASFSDFGSSSSLGVGGAFWFNDNSSVGLAFNFASDATVAFLGYRFAF